ncbi:MAG TPA: DegV family protein [Thermoleophilaceae bacterium]|nr:DegV family protein [Thermoleophilaceae bacterium]
MGVAVCSDTTNYLPRDLVARNGIHEVSLYVALDGDQQREADILEDTDRFYDALRATDSAATTSQPAVGDFVSAWRPVLEAGDDVISVHISSAISGTYGSAVAARDLLVSEGIGEEGIEVVDSRRACGGLGLMLLAATAAARAGADLAAVRERVGAARDALQMWFAVDTLEYLRRGGRIGGAQAWLGSALKIKPILTLDGEITPIGRVRTSQRAFARMTEFADELHKTGRDGWVVQHIQAPDEAARLIEYARDVFGSEPAFVSEVGPVIGAHVGPGLLGIGGVPRELLR